MEYQKPRLDLRQLPRCAQNWHRMERMEGGRLCADCQKCIVDFRKMDAEAIARVHAFSKEPVCGYYTEAQLRNEPLQGKERLWQKWLVPALAFSSFWLKPNSLLAQQPDSIPTEQHLAIPTPVAENQQGQVKAQLKTDSILIRGQVVDQATAEPLPFASVFIESLEGGAATDFDGFFSIPVPIDRGGDTIVIGVSYVGYSNLQMEWIIPEEEIATGTRVLTIDQIQLTDELGITAFGVYVAPWPQRAWGRVTAPFRRFWHFVFRR